MVSDSSSLEQTTSVLNEEAEYDTQRNEWDTHRNEIDIYTSEVVTDKEATSIHCYIAASGSSRVINVFFSPERAKREQTFQRINSRILEK